jgi:ElaB/YqjD/DUF883 family membrane-anchored ribosome-binding protein
VGVLVLRSFAKFPAWLFLATGTLQIRNRSNAALVVCFQIVTQTSERRREQMPTTTVANGKATAFKLAHLTAKATEGKMLAEDLIEIGKRKAQRIVRKGYETGEDYLDESKRYIKHNPWKSVGVALGVGLSLGFLSGFIARRR